MRHLSSPFRTVPLALAAAALVLAGCQSGDQGSDQDDTTSDAPAAEAVSEIVIAVPNNAFVGFDPNSSNAPRADTSVISQIYSSLTTIGPELELEPDLAESWTLADDAESWDFTLREGVTFSNGVEVDADLVVANFERIQDPETESFYASLFDYVTDVEAVDESTVRFHTDGPYLDLPYRLSNIYIGDPDWITEHDITTEALGTGPYQAVSLSADTAVLEPNPDYYGEPAAFEQVTYRAIADEAARLAGLKTGEIDVATLIDPQNLAQLEETGTLHVGGVSSTRTMLYRFNLENEPLDDERVRQALNYAVDKAAITESLFEGAVDPDDVFPGSGSGVTPYPYDPDRARQLLADAGHADGFELELDVPEGSYVAGDKIAQVVAAQLEEVGVSLDINILPWTTWLDKTYTPEVADLTYFGYFSVDTRPLQTFNQFESGASQQRGEVPAAYDEALDAARRATSQEEQDAAFREAGDVLTEWAPFILLFPQIDTYAYNTALEWTPRRDSWVRASDFAPAG